KQLLTTLGGTTPAASAQASAAPPKPGDVPDEAPPSLPDIDAAKIVGKWTAKRNDGTTFALNLAADSTFTWSYQRGNQKQEFGGKYTTDGPVLVLERTDGAQMPGLVTQSAAGFNFKLYGGAADD